SNQSGVARGLITRHQLAGVNERVDELLGPIDGFFVCDHLPDSGCRCRKPRPGLPLAAARALGVPPRRCILVGDIASDVEAATRAGMRAILVPTEATKREEVDAAPERAHDLRSAVECILGGRRR
ncbi:MAG: hypothetical protein QOH00_445, partial [Gaiellales bacterium]|nr:hypothetical protein [Gaiellales bacterium]